MRYAARRFRSVVHWVARAVGRPVVVAVILIAGGFAGAACGTSTPADCSISESVDLAAPTDLSPTATRRAGDVVVAHSIVMPMLRDRSPSEAFTELRRAGWTATFQDVDIRYFGACRPHEIGVVRDQRPAAGVQIMSNTLVVVSVGSPRS